MADAQHPNTRACSVGSATIVGDLTAFDMDHVDSRLAETKLRQQGRQGTAAGALHQRDATALRHGYRGAAGARGNRVFEIRDRTTLLRVANG